MPSRTLLVVGGCAALCLAVSVKVLAEEGETLAEKTQHKQWEDQVKGKMSFVSSKCGTDIPWTIEWKSFKAADLTKVSVGQYCADPLDALNGQTCMSKDGKAAVQKAIHKYVCVYGPKRSLSIKGGTLTYTTDLKSNNNTMWCRDEIAKQI
jgi:hypothetical protein